MADENQVAVAFPLVLPIGPPLPAAFLCFAKWFRLVLLKPTTDFFPVGTMPEITGYY
jgi:hypothetical protein